MHRPALPLVALCLALTACGSNDASGANVSITAKDSEGGDVSIKSQGDGRFAMDIPGFKADVKIPKMLLANSDFDIDGVKLYPDAKVTSVNIDANDQENKRALVEIGFEAPAEPAKVRDWFVKAFADKGRTVTPAGNDLTGTTEDGDPFRMTFAAAGTATRGAIRIEDSSN